MAQNSVNWRISLKNFAMRIRPRIIRQRITFARTKQNKDKTLPSEVVIEDVTIKAGEQKSKMELQYERKLATFIGSPTLSKFTTVSQQQLISYFRIKKTEVVRDLGESAYEVDDSYNTASHESDSNEEVFEDEFY